MVRLVLELVLGPLLVGGATLACRRWGDQIGGLVSAFPAVVTSLVDPLVGGMLAALPVLASALAICTHRRDESMP